MIRRRRKHVHIARGLSLRVSLMLLLRYDNNIRVIHDVLPTLHYARESLNVYTERRKVKKECVTSLLLLRVSDLIEVIVFSIEMK